MWPHETAESQPTLGSAICGQQVWSNRPEAFWPDSTHPLLRLWSWRATSSVHPHPGLLAMTLGPRLSGPLAPLTCGLLSGPSWPLRGGVPPPQQHAKSFSRRLGGDVWMASIQFLNRKLHAHFLFGDISCVWTQLVLLPALKLSRTDTSEVKPKC